MTHPNNFLSWHLEPQSANEASKVLEGTKFAVGKPRAMGLPTADISCFYKSPITLGIRQSPDPPDPKNWEIGCKVVA